MSRKFREERRAAETEAAARERAEQLKTGAPEQPEVDSELAAALERQTAAKMRLATASRAVQAAIADEAAAMTAVLAADAAVEAARAAVAAIQADRAAASAPKTGQSYRVVKGGTFSQNGAMATVREGHIVTAAAYGRAGIESMRGRGIVLEPIG